jgi:hypothetical protein
MAWGIAAAAAASTLLLLWPLVPVLEIVDTRSGITAFCSRAQIGEEVVLSFVHSVNRRPVYDTLRLETDHLVIVRSRFDSFGAGMPEMSTQDGTLTVGEDGWLEWTVNRPFLKSRSGWAEWRSILCASGGRTFPSLIWQNREAP